MLTMSIRISRRVITATSAAMALKAKRRAKPTVRRRPMVQLFMRGRDLPGGLIRQEGRTFPGRDGMGPETRVLLPKRATTKHGRYRHGPPALEEEAAAPGTAPRC